MARPRSFTVHLAPAGGRTGVDERVEFVPDAFAVLAFVAPWLFFLLNRMWLAFALYLAAAAAVTAALVASGLPQPFATGISVGLHILIGLEAWSLKRWTLARRGYEEAAVVVAPNKDEAERRWFGERESANAPGGPAGPPSSPPPRSGPQDAGVLGLFPESLPRGRGFS